MSNLYDGLPYIEPRAHFWFKLAISEYQSAMNWRKLKCHKEAIAAIRRCRESLEIACG